MRKIMIIIFLIILLPTSVLATEYEAPQPPLSAQKYYPEETESFSDGLWHILKNVISELQPNLAGAAALSAKFIAVIILISVLKAFYSDGKKIVDVAGALCIGVLMLEPAKSMLNIGIDTIHELDSYSKLLLPIMTTAMATQGAVKTSAALYAGTAIFSTILSSLITGLMVPGIYILTAVSIADSAVGEGMLSNLKKFIKWLLTWSLKILLYVFTGYIAITGVISGSADTYAIKATKIAISGAVPVVGGIISDASEAILVSTGIMKNSVGTIGLLAILAICVGPFLRIGVQYILMQLTNTVCGIIGTKSSSNLIQDFSSIIGYILAITGTSVLLLIVSVVCFLKGVP